MRPPSSGWAVANPSSIRSRVYLCAAFLAIAFGGLLARLWYLQIVQGASYFAQARSNRIARVPLPAPRGLILDRNGVPLATSRSQHSVAIVPGTLPSSKREPEARDQIFKTLAFLLRISPADITERLEDAQKRGGRLFDPVTIAEGVDLRTITLIEENKPRLGASILVTNDLKRRYPNGVLAAHVLGYSGIVTERDLQRSRERKEGEAGRDLQFDDIIGKSGIERQYDALLAGERGSEEYEVDSRGRPVRPRGRVAEVPGATVKLTLDSKLQRAAETALAKARNNGAVAAVDVQSGEVLVLAGRPAFDPNLFSLPRKEFSAAYTKLVNSPGHPLLNRPVVSRFPPGSTFKIMTGAAGLEQGTTTTNSHSFCAGGMRMGRFFGCWATHSDVGLMKSYAMSCDVFYYQASLRMGNPESSGPTYLAKIARQFGLGSKTGIDLPSDEAGLIPDPEWRKRVNKNRPDLAHWYPGNTLNMSIGQGDVLATPLQMALATAAVANGGTLYQPHLLLSATSPNGKKVLKTGKKQGKSIGISAKNLALIRQGLREVVTKGTGKSVALAQVEVAGKTGSAEDANHVLPHAWWVCFAPYKNPKIAIAVMVENSGHGSENAAPIAKAILETAFPAPKN